MTRYQHQHQPTFTDNSRQNYWFLYISLHLHFTYFNQNYDQKFTITAFNIECSNKPANLRSSKSYSRMKIKHDHFLFHTTKKSIKMRVPKSFFCALKWELSPHKVVVCEITTPDKNTNLRKFVEDCLVTGPLVIKANQCIQWLGSLSGGEKVADNEMPLPVSTHSFQLWVFIILWFEWLK